MYTPERLVAIAKEAVREDSLFSLEDRIGLVYDSLALACAGYLEVSAVLPLYDVFRNEKECGLHPSSTAKVLCSISSHHFIRRLRVGLHLREFLRIRLDVVRVSADPREAQRFPKGMSMLLIACVGSNTDVMKELFVRIVDRLGYDYAKGESVDIHQLRTTAITEAANAGDEG